MPEGKILGFIVSKDWTIIDPKRVEAIEKIGLLGSKKSMQSFLGNINFVRIFVPYFAQIVRPLQDLVKKESLLKYFDVQKDAFKSIKKAIMEAPTLFLPEFSRDFVLYNFSTDISYDAMLSQRNNEDVEIPVSLMSSTFKGAKFNYT